MHKGLTPLMPMICDKIRWHKANVWVIEQEGKGELQGDLKQLKEGLGDVLRVL